MGRFRYIGGRFPKVDAFAKATGRALYADDLALPGMLHGRLLRSIAAHARILDLDVSAAREAPGARAVITGGDLPIPYGILPVSQDERALAVGKVRYIGEPVAAVAADSEEAAEAALRLMRVEYEPLPAVLSIEDALAAKGEPVQSGGNLHKAIAFEFGANGGLSPASDYSREDAFFYEGNTHAPLEEHAALARWDAEGPVLWSSTQTPFLLRKVLAKVFGLEEDGLRVIAPAIGGGFGGKLDPFPHEVCALKLARTTGRPVKFALTREEVFYCHRGRHPARLWIRTAWSKDGELQDLHFKSCLDGGAYGSFGVVCTFYQGALQPTTYRTPRYRLEAARVYTNKPPCGPKRGHGTVQARFALEIHLDKVASDLGIDPVTLRLKNLVGPDTVTVNHMQVTSSGLKACIERVAEKTVFRRRWRQMPKGRGIGFAAGAYLSGAAVPIYWNDQPHSGVRVEVDAKGGVSVYSGATDIGQGSDTMAVAVVAEVLGLDPGHIRLVAADTARAPLDLGSYSSRVTFMAGNAAKDAAEKLKAMLAAGKKAPLSALGSYTPPPKLARYKGSGVGPSPAYSFSACAVEVECDPGTGRVRVAKVTFAHDIGRALNRSAVEGQIEGAVHMALGEAFLEAQTYLPQGLHRGPNLLDYKLLTAVEMPELDIHLVETIDPAGPFGAKEVGQGPLLPIIPAVANAIYNALGVRIDETPFTPEKVLAALERRAAGRPARVGPEGFPAVPFPEPVRVGPLGAEAKTATARYRAEGPLPGSVGRRPPC